MTNTLKNNLFKIRDIMFFYETMACKTDDPFCKAYLQKCSDKKRSQLIAMEKFAHNHGIELIVSNGENPHHAWYLTDLFIEIKLDAIFNFASSESLNILKNTTFLSIKSGTLQPVFQKLFELEEEFLVFVQEEYLRQLTESAVKVDELPDSVASFVQ
jgi:hypothetical protein